MARRRRDRPSAPHPEPNRAIPVADLLGRHLLLVPEMVEAESVSQRLRDRVPDSDLMRSGQVSFGRHSTLSGPYVLSMEAALDAGVPMPWTVCYCLETPTEREDPPLPGVDDRDGFAYAFPEGLPWRDEGRWLHLLVSLARRFGGAVRVAKTLQVILPDPDRAVDHVVHSPGWLAPVALLGVVGRELPGADLAVEGQDWDGPPDAAYSGAMVADDITADPLNAAELHQLHAAADEQDLDALAAEDVLDAFAIAGDLGWDGVIEVLVHLGDGEEPAVASEPWAADEYVTYEIRWVGRDPAERERRYPSPEFLGSRSRVAPLVAAVARSIVEAAGGVVLDEDGFRVNSSML